MPFIDPDAIGNKSGFVNPDTLNAPEITGKSSVPMSVRAGMSMKITPEGKTSYLESHYGKGNVHVLDTGAAFIKNKNGDFSPVDESAFTMGDFADEAGPALQTVPAAVAGVLTASPMGAAAGGAAGSVIRQGVSSMLPGEDNLSVKDRLKMPIQDALIAGITQGAVNQGFKVIDWAKPKNIVARHVQKKQQTPFSKEGEALTSQVGPLTMGQQTGSRPLLMSEGVARKMLGSADDVFRFDQYQLATAVGKLDDLLGSIKKTSQGPDTVGSQVTKTYTGAVNKVLDIRRKQAAIDFGEVDKMAGGSKILNTKNTAGELDKIIADLDTPAGGDATATLVSKVKALKSQLMGTPEKSVKGAIVDASGNPLLNSVVPAEGAKVSANEMNRLLQIYGNASKGKGQIFTDIDKSQQRMIATRLFRALQGDLDEAADSMGENSVAQALKVARDNYKANSQSLGKLEETVIGRMLNSEIPPAPEAIANKFMTMYPTEVRASLNIIRQADPGTADGVKRYMLDEIMRKSIPSPSGQAANGIRFSGAKFNKQLADNLDVLKEVYTPSELTQINQVSRYLERLSDRASTDGSPTAPLMMAWDAVKGVFTLNPIAIGKSTAAFLAPRHVARAMTTPEGRKALVTLSSTSKPTKGAISSANYLVALIALDADPATTDEPPQ